MSLGGKAIFGVQHHDVSVSGFSYRTEITLNCCLGGVTSISTQLFMFLKLVAKIETFNLWHLCHFDK